MYPGPCSTRAAGVREPRHGHGACPVYLWGGYPGHGCTRFLDVFESRVYAGCGYRRDVGLAGACRCITEVPKHGEKVGEAGKGGGGIMHLELTCRPSLMKAWRRYLRGIPKCFVGQVFFEAWGTNAKKHHTFSGNKWFVGLGTPGLQKTTWPKNHFGVPLICDDIFCWCQCMSSVDANVAPWSGLHGSPLQPGSGSRPG